MSHRSLHDTYIGSTNLEAIRRAAHEAIDRMEAAAKKQRRRELIQEIFYTVGMMALGAGLVVIVYGYGVAVGAVQ